MIVIPMAGESRRFREAGYDRPKYMLPLDDRPLFDWSILSFSANFASERFLFIARDVAGTAAFLDQRISALGLSQALVVLLDSPTSGQAETVELGLERSGASDAERLAIFNIDTIRPGASVGAMTDCAGWLEVFSAPGNNWSFVEPDPAEPRFARRCVEKQRISDLCCTGLYVFERADLFGQALAAERAQPSAHELFVAPLYNHLIAAGHHIGWRAAPEGSVHLSGVPAEYEALKARGVAFDFFGI